MKPGPRPTPTAILKARGSWRASLRPNEPKPPRGRPRCPRWLSKEARRKFRETCRLMEQAGTLTVIDGDALARYADTWAWHRRCREFIERYGETFPVYDEAGTLVGYRPYPQVALANTLAGLLGRLEQELGLTPSGRTRIRVDAPCAEPESQAARFFRRPA